MNNAQPAGTIVLETMIPKIAPRKVLDAPNRVRMPGSAAGTLIRRAAYGSRNDRNAIRHGAPAKSPAANP